jgi:hypothetical protein
MNTQTYLASKNKCIDEGSVGLILDISGLFRVDESSKKGVG